MDVDGDEVRNLEKGKLTSVGSSGGKKLHKYIYSKRVN